MPTDTEQSQAQTKENPPGDADVDLDKQAADHEKDKEGLYDKDLNKGADDSDKDADADKGEASGKDPEGDKDADKDKGDDKDKDAELKGAPESYEDFNVPEGVEINADRMAEFKSFSRKKDWSQKEAQEVSDYHTAALASRDKASVDAHLKQVDEWIGEARTDKEYGGEKFKENMVNANKILEMFSDPAVDKDGAKIMVLDAKGKPTSQQATKAMQSFAATGRGSDPEIVRLFHRIYKAIGPDYHVVRDGGVAISEKDAADIFYGDYEKEAKKDAAKT